MKAPFFEGTDSVSMFLYALDRNAVEKSASCELHRVSEAYRPHPPFSARFEHILLLTRRPLLLAPQMGSFLHGMPSKGMAAVLFPSGDAGEGHGRALKVFISSFFSYNAVSS